jgi:hypothetical protein
MARLRRIESLGITSPRDQPWLVTQKCFFLEDKGTNTARSAGIECREDLLGEFRLYTDETEDRDRKKRLARRARDIQCLNKAPVLGGPHASSGSAERKFFNSLNLSSVRPELCRRMNGIFQYSPGWPVRKTRNRIRQKTTHQAAAFTCPLL